MSVVFAAMPAASEDEEPPLPEDKIVVDIDAAEEEVYRIGIPDLIGEPKDYAVGGADVLRNDFRLMPGFRVIGPAAIRHDFTSRGIGVDLAAWSVLGANGVIKGVISSSRSIVSLELRFYQSTGAGAPALRKAYRGSPDQVRKWMHDFANEVIAIVTGVRGPFGTEVAFARKLGPGQKSVYAAGMDGYGLRRVSSGGGIAMLPSYGAGAIWYTRLSSKGMFITNTRVGGRRVIGGKGINMAPTICGDRVYFTSSRHGNSEIYSANLDGSAVRRLTRSRAIDVSPTCGPGSKLAFVSNRHGSPQVFMMNRDGSDVKRVTFRGGHNQTPVWCMDPEQPLIAFSGRDANFDIFTVNVETQEYRRLTQGQGDNKDPAFSPDCRLIAFTSNRRGGSGVYLSGLDGLDQNQVIEGGAETVRWSR
jgi:TolB protein